jgi:hypothetical protein
VIKVRCVCNGPNKKSRLHANIDNPSVQKHRPCKLNKNNALMRTRVSKQLITRKNDQLNRLM